MARPENFEFAMDFLGDPEAADVLKYVEQLEDALQKVLDDSEVGVVPRSHLDKIAALLEP